MNKVAFNERERVTSTFTIRTDSDLHVEVDEVTGITRIHITGRPVEVGTELGALEQVVMDHLGTEAAHAVVAAVETELDKAILLKALMSRLVR